MQRCNLIQYDMATIYFDVGDDVLLADGKTLQDNTLTTPPNSIVALSYMPAKSGALAQLVKLIVRDNIVQAHDRPGHPVALLLQCFRHVARAQMSAA